MLVLVLSSSFPLVASLTIISAKSVLPVHNVDTRFDYATMQEAINAPETDNGDTILVDSGIYFEHMVVNKSVRLIGENKNTTIIDGNGTGIPVYISRSNVLIQNFTIQNSGPYYPSSGVNTYSRNNTIFNNIIKNNLIGIYLTGSHGNNLTSNYVSNSLFGIWLDHGSTNNVVIGNVVSSNTQFGLYAGLYSNNNTFADNTILNNYYGICFSDTTNNTVVHNNFIGNIKQADAYSSANKWDSGYEGNFWNNHSLMDSNADGIGDNDYKVAEDNVDHYPLMGAFTGFKTPYGYDITTISNSTVSNFGFEIVHSQPPKATLSLNVHVENGSQGFCRVSIPKPLINGSYEVMLDGWTITYPQVRELPSLNETYKYFYIYYTYGEHRIDITGTTTIPEFPSSLTLISLVIFSLVAVVLARKRTAKRYEGSSSQSISFYRLKNV
jgi:parallel beta-helix repeat protein